MYLLGLLVYIFIAFQNQPKTSPYEPSICT